MPQLLLAGPALAAHLPALSEAITCLEDRLSSWASNAGAYDALLRRAFTSAGTDAAAWSHRAEALREQLVSTGLNLSLKILSASQWSDLLGAYSPASPGGGEVVFLHPNWIQSATAAQIEAVLLEELGHAIDGRLNGAADSSGDEGEVFSALLRGETPNPGAYNENDQRLITLAGTGVAVEAATLSLVDSVTRLATRSSTYSGNPSIDALLQSRTLKAPASIRYFFPDSSLLSAATDALNRGAWALDSLQQDQFRQVIAEWSAVALVDPQQVPSLDQASMSVFGISQGNSNVQSINGSPLTMEFIPDGGPFQTGGFERGTIIHEMGHALGLKHPFEGRNLLSGEENGFRYTMMAYDSWYDELGQFVEPTTPQLYDIRAIQYLYGANTTYRSGNDDYQWGSGDIVFRSLWDGGGQDTINAANQAQFVQINLNPGSFSVIGRAIFQETFVEDPDGNVTQTTTTTVNGVKTEVIVRGNYIERSHRDNLSIAYGAVIENAIGSAFSDRLQGNAANNRLSGLAGNDILDGGAGNDILSGGSGADLYLFGQGSGHDTVYNADEDSIGTKADTIELGAGITSTGVTLTRTRFSDDLTISLNGSNDSLTVKSFFSNDGTSRYLVENLKFSDDTVWDVATIKAQAITSTPDPTILTVSLAADTGLDPIDGITANGTVVVERLEPRAAWQYSTDGGSSWSNGSGSSLRLRGVGVLSVIARQLDSQGNASPASAPLAFFLDDGAGLRLATDLAQLIYVAYYGRPADPGGLSFWDGVLGSNGVSYAPRLGDGLTGAEFDIYNRIVNDFGNSTEATNLLAGLTSQQQVNQVYQFCFNRNAELDPITGKNYWLDQLDRGNVSLAQLAVEVALGAQAEDIVVFSNKISSAKSFTDAIDTPPELAAFRGEQARLFGISYLDGFGATAAGSELGKLALEEFLAGSSSFVGLA